MAIKIVKGNIFNTNAQTIVNTVNCVGVMGKGIALVFKLRYPKMFSVYKEFCKLKFIDIGKLWLYKGEENAPWVLNFPTKFNWKYPSKIEYLEKGLQKFCTTYEEQGVTSIAFPLLGSHNGGLDKQLVLDMMNRYLSKCNIEIEIYEYMPDAKDDLYKLFAINWTNSQFDDIKSVTGIRKDKFDKITEVIISGEAQSMISLINTKGIGIKTLEKCFQFVLNKQYEQLTMFDK
jgi:O-acetyl-ADP-ribose deacetylase (regulator of RNase III)